MNKYPLEGNTVKLDRIIKVWKENKMKRRIMDLETFIYGYKQLDLLKLNNFETGESRRVVKWNITVVHQKSGKW